MLNAARIGGVFCRNVARMKIGGGQFKNLADVRGKFRYASRVTRVAGCPSSSVISVSASTSP